MNKKTLILGIIVGLLISTVAFFLLRDSESDTNRIGSQFLKSSTTAGQPSAQLLNAGLNVNFTKSSIDLSQVLNGGPGKDGIPALTNPDFVSIVDARMSSGTQVMVVEHNGEVKIYPYNILVWHEIVNDYVGGKPLAITFCPLCGSAIVFDRQLDGEVIDFGVSGFLYESNMLMYSRENQE